jgi:hypothetical protein
LDKPQSVEDGQMEQTDLAKMAVQAAEAVMGQVELALRLAV